MKDNPRMWCTLLSLLTIFNFLGSAVNLVYADIDVRKPAVTLLQYKAGSHIIGFGNDKVYLANMAGALRIEFLNPQAISPRALNEAGAPSQETQSSIPTNRKTLENLSRIEYRNLWRGITLRYDAVDQGISESTYIVEPGAEVADIGWRYNADAEVRQDGSLKITLASQQGYITESRPVAWQIINGKKVAVDVAYTLNDGVAGFLTGHYNRAHELIIDPTYSWHTFYGSLDPDYAAGIAIDSNENIYVTGMSSASWLGPNNTAPKHAFSGGSDIFVVKLHRSGAYLWHTFFGSTSSDSGYAIAVDNNDDVYVAGESNSSWLGPSNTDPKNEYNGSADIVILKLNNTGNYLWHTFFGSTSKDCGNSIAINGQGYIYVTGVSHAGWSVTNSLNKTYLPKNPYSGTGDIVVLCINSSGTFQWHTFFGSNMSDQGNGIVALGNDIVFIVGSSYATWNGPGNSSPKYPYAGESDIVGVKLTSSGDYIGHTFLGSAAADDGWAVNVDQRSNIYIAGDSTTNWGTPIIPHYGNGKSDMVVVKLDSSGTFQWNTFLGSPSSDVATSISVDRNGNSYVAGFSAGWGSPINPYSGGIDIVISALNNAGQLKWHTFFGSSDPEHAIGVSISGNGDIYTTGISTNTWGSPVNAYQGGSDIVVLKLKPFYWPMFLPAITQ